MELVAESDQKPDAKKYAAEMDACVQEKIKAEQAAKAKTQPPPQPPPPTKPTIDKSARLERIMGVVLGGVGLALVITGIAEGAVAATRANELRLDTTGPVPNSCVTATDIQMGSVMGAVRWNPCLSNLEAQGKTAENVAIATGVVGAVAIAGGALLWYFGYRHDKNTKFSMNHEALVWHF
jgi:hypothetical protein